jgi:hypothetical protein
MNVRLFLCESSPARDDSSDVPADFKIGESRNRSGGRRAGNSNFERGPRKLRSSPKARLLQPKELKEVFDEQV